MSNAIDPSELARVVEMGEAEAFVDIFAAADRSLGCHVERHDGAVMFFAPKFDAILFNRVIGLGLTTPASPAAIQSAVRAFQESGVKNFAVQVSPESQPAELGAWLESSALPRRDNWAKMYHSAVPEKEIMTDLRIELCTETRAEVFGATAAAGFGMPATWAKWISATVGRPGWRHYMAFDGDRPAATAALFVKSGIGWLGVAATLPEFRKRGAQGNMMVCRIRDAIADGCEWIITETGEELPDRRNSSYHNMIRTGFKLAYQRPNYIAQSPAP